MNFDRLSKYVTVSQRGHPRSVSTSHRDVTIVGIGLWEHPMDVSMVVVGRGKHVVGYSLLAIKSID